MQTTELELTEADYKLLIDGLDALPNRSSSSEFLHDLIVDLLGKTHPEQAMRLKRERELENKKINDAREALIEEVRILQGKLFCMKRINLQNKAVNATNDILNK